MPVKRRVKSVFGAYFLALTLVTLFLMLLPLVTRRLPHYVYNTDVSYHYKLVLLISQDLSNIAYDTYPKLFHTSAALLTKTGLSVADGMYAVTLFFALLYPVVFYLLADAIFGDRRKSLVAALLSVVFWVEGPQALSGLSMVAPNMIAVVFFAATLLFLVRERYVSTGVTLGLYAMTHNSFMLAAFAVFLYFLLWWYYSKDWQRWKPFFMIAVVAGVVAAPFFYYVYSNYAYDLYGVFEQRIVADPPVSLFSIPFVMHPFVIAFAVSLLGAVTVVRRQGKNMNQNFIVLLFLVVILVSQSYFLGIFGQSLLKSVLFIPARALYFLLIPSALLAAHYIVERVREPRILFLIPIVFVAVSVPSYWNYHEKTDLRLDGEDLQVLDLIQATGEPNARFLYNPSHTRSWLLINMGGGFPLEAEKGYFLLGSRRTDSRVSYVLENRNDTLVAGYTENHRENLKEIFGNERYVIYKTLGMIETVNYDSLEAYATGFAVFLNNHPKIKDIFTTKEVNRLYVRFTASDSRETVCLKIERAAEVTGCAGHDIELTAESSVLKELLASYSVHAFFFKLHHFYDDGSLEIRISERFHFKAPVTKNVDARLYLKDLRLAVEIKDGDATARYSESGDGTPVSFHYIAKTMKWTMTGAPRSYPNIIFGLSYATLSEFM